MYSYSYIDSDDALYRMLENWIATSVTTVAMDFEGEFNLHIYGEHLCLVQLYDQRRFYLLDPFKVSAAALKALLESPWLEKIMFDCSSDAALVRKQYNIQLKRVYDVKIVAAMLGYTGNLSSLKSQCVHTEPEQGKKKKQMANWLVRPLPKVLIDYALADVEHLFTIKHVLVQEVLAKKMEQQVLNALKRATVQKNPDIPSYEKISGYRNLSAQQKIFMKWFFASRDTVAREQNLPAYRIMEKSKLLEMAKHAPLDNRKIHDYVRHKNNSIENRMLTLMLDAHENAMKELSSSD